MVKRGIEDALFGRRSASNRNAAERRAPRLRGSGSRGVEVPSRPFQCEVIAGAGHADKREADAHRDPGRAVRGERDPPARPGALRARAVRLWHAVVLPRTAGADIAIELCDKIDGELVGAAA